MDNERAIVGKLVFHGTVNIFIAFGFYRQAGDQPQASNYRHLLPDRHGLLQYGVWHWARRYGGIGV